MPYNPVLLFKPQGVEQLGGMNDLAKDDFLLVLQTEFQKDAMKCYGNKAILMIPHIALLSIIFSLYLSL